MSTRPPKQSNLSWFKYNPAELLGKYNELTDTEYGFFHKVIAKLWATPGNRMTRTELMQELRIRPGAEREGLLDGLIGYALKEDTSGQLFIAALDDAFADATARTEVGRAGAQGRWSKRGAPTARTTPQGDGEF